MNLYSEVWLRQKRKTEEEEEEEATYEAGVSVCNIKCISVIHSLPNPLYTAVETKWHY